MKGDYMGIDQRRRFRPDLYSVRGYAAKRGWHKGSTGRVAGRVLMDLSIHSCSQPERDGEWATRPTTLPRSAEYRVPERDGSLNRVKAGSDRHRKKTVLPGSNDWEREIGSHRIHSL
jgi:hypothetical protein